MFSPKKKPISNDKQNIPIISLENETPAYLLKDFKVAVNQTDFLKLKEDSSQNIGIFDDVIPLLYKNNKNIYYVKVIEKKNIINTQYQNILNQIYKINNKQKNTNTNVYDYILNLQTHWEDTERLFLVFSGIKRYTSLGNLLKNHSKNLTEENIIAIFRQILEIVFILQENNIYGCNLYIDSFIFDKLSKTVKLTDLGFSKFYKSNRIINDNKLQDGFEFNDYVSPEFIAKMNDSSNIYSQDKFKNVYYDIWQLGILFYKIATFGESPYGDAQNENLKESIMNKNINYSKLNNYSPQISQIIDKMLQTAPNNRYTIDKLLNLEIFKSLNRIPLIMITPKNEEKPITMNMVINEKEKNKDKLDIASAFEKMEALLKSSKGAKNLVNYEEDEKNQNEKKSIRNSNKNILKQVKIQGNLVNDKTTMISQEIYPDGSVIPIFKNKFLNKFNNVDINLVLDLSNKLTMLEKEYKKLDENKLAVYNITNYVNNNIKELNYIDNENIETLIKKFNNLQLSKIETNDLYEEMLRNKDEFAKDKFKALISNLIYEIKRLEIELDQEKLIGEKLRKKIKEQEKKNMDLKIEVQEKVEFYEKKIELLEEVIFNVDNKNNKEDLKNNLIFQALTNSIKNFTDINIKLKESLEENISKFKENKKNWLLDMIKAKENFRNEIQMYLQKAVEPPKIYNFEKKENKDVSNKNKSDEKIEELKRKITELNDLVKEQKILIDNNTNLIKELKKEIKSKEEKNEELTRLLNNKEKEKEKEKETSK
jgi:serine/threonine protein kinase